PDAGSRSPDRWSSSRPARSGSCRECSSCSARLQPSGGEMKRSIVLGVLVAIGAVSMTVAAFQSPAPGPTPQELEATKIEKVKDNLYMITGSNPTPREAFSGGNTAVFITDTGVVIVDTKLRGWGQVILDKIKTVTPKPVTMIINTHTHGDHTG